MKVMLNIINVEIYIWNLNIFIDVVVEILFGLN